MTFDTAILQALWHWMGTHAFAIFAGIYVGSALCLIALACRLSSLARRLAAVERASEKQAALIGRLMRSVDEQTLALGALQARAPAEQKRADADGAATDRTTTFKAVRDDIETLIADMLVDSSEHGDPML